MEIQYVIINFIILAVILVIVGRKTVKSIFGNRLEKINNDLNEAEEAEKLSIPVFEEYQSNVDIADNSESELKARATIDEKIEHINDFRQRELSEIHREMIEDARKELFQVMKENVIKISNNLACGHYVSTALKKAVSELSK